MFLPRTHAYLITNTKSPFVYSFLHKKAIPSDFFLTTIRTRKQSDHNLGYVWLQRNLWMTHRHHKDFLEIQAIHVVKDDNIPRCCLKRSLAAGTRS